MFKKTKYNFDYLYGSPKSTTEMWSHLNLFFLQMRSVLCLFNIQTHVISPEKKIQKFTNRVSTR